MTTALNSLLSTFRNASQSEREKGTYFEELIATYLRYEATYKDLYEQVWTYSTWAKEQGKDGKDTGIDLVAKTRGTNEYHAIQCKFYDEDYKVQKKDIDSFFTASGKKPFTHRVIVATTNSWSEHAEEALRDQNPPVTKIDLHDLANSQIDWSKYQAKQTPILKPKKKLRPHQENALARVEKGLEAAERGKLIMACGTGKTFTSLKIAEKLAGKNKRVLFLVPSLSLLSQTLTEWTQESETPQHSFAVCSDSDIGKKRKADDDTVQTFTHELRYPATTNAQSLAEEMESRHDADHMSVVYSTYHSIDVISQAQKEHGLANFDLIICDEAHRTTGATFEGEEESNFVKIHDGNFIKGAKRLYMTATPRIYGDSAQAKAENENVALASMDDEKLYGKELHVLTFSEAVTRRLLVDYKVIVLTVDEAHISSRLQKLLAGDDNQLKVDDAAKIIGCWKALSKKYQEDATDDNEPMRKAVAFCQVIEAQKGGKTHKVSSKNIASMFQAVVEAYQEKEEDHETLACEAEHIDGSMNASQKEQKLEWLKAETPEDTCRILSNVRCLSEGVDVPALDAVLFLTPRNSQVDVVQSVGRIMRNAPGKTRGYVILPVVIPTGMEPHDALNDNKTYKVVWDVLQALRSHDDRFDAMINKFDLVGKNPAKMEVISITDKIQAKQKKSNDKKDKGKGSYSIGSATPKPAEKPQGELQFEIGEIERALYAKMVQKCGNRNHWEDWAKDIAKIAQTHITRVRAIINDPSNTKEIKAFNDFADELRDDLNNQITDEEVIEMLAQHLITKPVFDALFDKYSFASHNPVSQAMQNVLDVLQEHRLDKETDTLERFYTSVKIRADGIEDATAKQKIVVELYDKFFRNAFPKMTEKLGIVYTPVEVVDFIIHSINDVLQQEFGENLGSKGVHILDPFTGTGTFVTRLLQSGLINVKDLPYKYKNEIHANELVLLAYYIAAINIEAVYHGIAGGDYVPFKGICLTDTFRLSEDDMISQLLADNSDRRKRQQNLDIRVIIGNPPYSGGQDSANDQNTQVEYLSLNRRVSETYAAHSSANSKKDLINSYIGAIRWASDRIKDNGVIGFVTGNAFIEKSFADGMRKCLAEEFSSLHVINLRGDIRKNIFNKGASGEGGNIFSSGSQSGIAITIFVKNRKSEHKGNISYYDIGNDLSTKEKLGIIKNTKSCLNIKKWEKIYPDKHNDWINQRDDRFYEFISIGDKKDKNHQSIFDTYALGLNTNRDPWCYNSSKIVLSSNIKNFTDFYNNEVNRYANRPDKTKKAEDFVDYDSKKIKWSSSLLPKLEKGIKTTFEKEKIRLALYRPFTKQYLYFDNILNHRVSKNPEIFPSPTVNNKTIIVSGVGSRNGLSVMMSDLITDLNALEGGAQCFPLYIYDTPKTPPKSSLFSDFDKSGDQRRDGITDNSLVYFSNLYESENITKEDIFYYIYGLLHSQEYQEKYADNLTKQLPRIPRVRNAKDFWLFSKAGRQLADLHVGYENAVPYDVIIDRSGQKLSEKEYYVTKMKFVKKGDKSAVVYNDHITIRSIPVEAFDYVVNGKSALEWVMERQSVKIDKDTGIVNDANLYAIETIGDPSYPLKLFQRVITVSLETMKIVRSLPKLDIMQDNA